MSEVPIEQPNHAPESLPVPNDEETQEVEETLQEILPEEVKDIPKDQLRRIISVVMKQSHHSGPIPSPDSMAKYNEVIPDGANRIMVQSEEQGRHRREMERTVIRSQSIQTYLGQIFAFIVAISCMYVSYSMVMSGHEKQGALFGGVTIVGLVTIFIVGKSKVNDSLKKKKG